jgi:Serine carboxypeptidase S28
MPPRGDYGSIASDESDVEVKSKPFEKKKKLDWRNFPLTFVGSGIVLTLVVCALLTVVSRGAFGKRGSVETLVQEDPPAVALEFAQIVDHNRPRSSGKFAQKYYENVKHWEGPGHPIFVIIGGEGPVDGIVYPFISEILAATFGAYTIEPEHRSVLLFVFRNL